MCTRMNSAALCVKQLKNCVNERRYCCHYYRLKNEIRTYLSIDAIKSQKMQKKM